MLAYLLLWIIVCVTPLHVLAQKPQTTFDSHAPLAQGLINWWKAIPHFTGGTYMYDLMGGPPLTLTSMGTAGTTSGWRTPTRQGGSGEIAFDGSDDILTTPVSSAIFPPYFTMMLWVRAIGGWAGDYTLLWEAVNGGANIFVTPTGHLATYSAGTIDPSPTVLAVGTWYHITMVMNVAQIQLYVNCILDSSVGIGGPSPANAFRHLFGNKVTPANRLSGVMDDMKFYNRGLTAPEICTAMRQSQLGDPQLLPDTYGVRQGQPFGYVFTTLTKDNFFPFFRKQLP